MDLGSGMDTQKVIQKLLRIERVPIERIKMENEKSQVYIKAWEEARKRAGNLQEKSRQLYSFAGPFERKVVEASEPGTITGEAAGHVQDASRSIEVKRLATRHRIHSAPVHTDKRLPAGTFSISINGNTESFRFSGGTIRDLVSLIEKQKSKNFETYTIQVDGDHLLVGFHSSETGKRGEIRIEDPDGILQAIDLVGDLKQADPNPEPIQFYSSAIEDREGHSSIRAEGSELVVEASGVTLWRKTFQKNQILVFQTELEEGSEKKSVATLAEPSHRDTKPDSKTVISKRRATRMGPDIRVEIDGVEFEGEQIERNSPEKIEIENPKEDENQDQKKETPEQEDNLVTGVRVIGQINGERRVSFIPIENNGKSEIAFKDIFEDGSVTGVEFVSGSKEMIITAPKVMDVPEGFGPLHVKNEARDALLVVNGVEITRSRNEQIKDLFDGVSLNLHRETEGPVTVNIHSNTDQIIADIQSWVESYNEMMKFIRENSKAAKEEDFKLSRPGRDSERIGQGLDTLDSTKGIFASDSTARRIVTTLRESTSKAYPTRMEPAYRILSDIGITTGKPGSNWESNRYGYLNIEESRLREAIQENPQAVRELFASDTDNNLMVDNGVAYTIYEDMKAFTSVSGGLITVRINVIKEKIADNKQRVDRMELSLENKEQQLRQKFGRMERSIRENKAQGDFLRSRLGGGSGG